MKDIMDDQELLREFVERQSQEAFRELVERHLAMVYSAARRMVGNAHLAEDVAQGGFTALAQKADRLGTAEQLAGWLYHTTRHLAMHAVRTEQRRREREQTATTMQALDTDRWITKRSAKTRRPSSSGLLRLPPWRAKARAWPRRIMARSASAAR